MSFFNEIPLLSEDPIFGLPIAFAADPRPDKINLGIGAYKTAEGLPLVLTSVKKAELLMLQKNMDKEYLPIQGDSDFLAQGLKLLYGDQHPLLLTKRVFAAQAVGGSSALRIAAEFLQKLITKQIFISQPSWTNHQLIFQRAGLKIGSYPYYNPQTNTLDFEGLCQSISHMPASSAILLHGCCHNPTGLDLSLDQWKILADLIKKQRLIPLFDIAYQGFGQSLDEDAQSVRYFVDQGHELIAAYSFAKNFGLYGERAGFLSVVSSTEEQSTHIKSQIKNLIRGNFSNAPLHGARIVSTILKSLELKEEWKCELQNMCGRIKEMRKALVSSLLAKSQGHDFSHLYQQQGLFSFIGLNTAQVERLKAEHGIYLPDNGRINIAGLNSRNLNQVVDALLSVMN